MILDICQCGKEHAELIADLSRKTFFDTFASQNSSEDMDKFLDEQFTKEALMKEVGMAGNMFFLAYVDNEVVGYLKLREGKFMQQINGRASLEIARIYTVHKMIGKGIGSALMQKSIDVAREKNKGIIWLGVWKENTKAIDFYKRWGFEIFGEQDFLLGNDLQKDWLMKKKV